MVQCDGKEFVLGTVVYIDDEKTLCRVFERLMKRMSVPVVTFDDPAAAIRHISDANDVVAIVCDYRMPQMTGLQVLDALMPYETLFFIVSGDHSLNDTLASDSRLAGVLGKPFSREVLQETFHQFAT